jgi:hypothetical protein
MKSDQAFERQQYALCNPRLLRQICNCLRGGWGGGGKEEEEKGTTTELVQR